ncbi:AbrB/MazE/SpoVT family DNA-binding domain-containing protein [Metabacillus fastidiosus]|uniref:AbrB/MazE/SpoVT family DNA-binding domain-containing protein n=1 Tax=Metabacillus fastidiosus TaxID=1458 RepID=UPI0008269B81|nr:AbrB/MazE/SpoVT family DNA-binding domain-containing protein [Metabacillus fastidiosus]MED4455720.1 AbrB/MazE/SpoVT family DNA-binding domain-containing protein [Metabacillus fastidiosus]MED4462075.1 AbrB/MazE/SpoVT family DNA-binding domain-containing protein [Metabacillus fastidiosus]
MKSTGVVRRMDQLGRVVLPKELRRTMNIDEKDPMEILVEKDCIILRKYVPEMECIMTGKISEGNKVYAGNIILSREGAEELVKELEKTLL